MSDKPEHARGRFGAKLPDPQQPRGRFGASLPNPGPRVRQTLPNPILDRVATWTNSMFKITGWLLGAALVLFWVGYLVFYEDTSPGWIDCGRYATEQAGGKAFEGSAVYNAAKDDCDAANAKNGY